MGRVLYVTAKTPFGPGEAFVLSELCALRGLGQEMLIIPRDKGGVVFHSKAQTLMDSVLAMPLLDLRIAAHAAGFVFRRPRLFFSLIRETVFSARSLKIALKNLVVLPKGLYVSGVLEKDPVSHVHAHWGSTTATMSYVISRVTGIPWSFTVHRWDIAEDNILGLKASSASFVRAISEAGRRELLGLIDEGSAGKVIVVHMGAEMNGSSGKVYPAEGTFRILCPASFERVKGHKYLLEACRLMSDRGLDYRCLMAGDGPVEDEIRRMADGLSLGGSVEFMGRLTHEALFGMYASGEVGAVVLPSIITEDGEKEGIPVALMEAMSYGIPVVSTETGGIPELVGDGSGVLVPQRDPAGLARAIERLMTDDVYREETGMRGRQKVLEGFNLSTIALRLYGLFGAGDR